MPGRDFTTRRRLEGIWTGLCEPLMGGSELERKTGQYLGRLGSGGPRACADVNERQSVSASERKGRAASGRGDTLVQRRQASEVGRGLALGI